MRVSVFLLALVTLTLSASSQFWTSTGGPPASSSCLATNSKGHVFVGTPFSKVYRSADRGVTWEQFDQGIDDGGPTFYSISQIKVDEDNVLYAAIDGLGIFKSLNDGQSWQKMDIGLTTSKTARMTVDVRKLPGQETRILVGSDDGAKRLRMRLSSNNGVSFDSIPMTGLPGATSSLFEVFLSPTSGKIFCSVAYNKGLYRSENLGVTWKRIDNGDGNSNESDDLYTTFAADKDGNIYVGRNALPGSDRTKNAVVLKSTNDGEQWSYLLSGWDNRDITNNRISAISFGANGNMWVTTEKNSGPFMATNYGAGPWSVVSSGISGDGASTGIVVTKDNHVFVAPSGEPIYRHLDPSSVSESAASMIHTQVMPNPASDRITLTVVVDVASTVYVDLLNIAGQRVIDGYSASLTPGESNRVSLSTTALPQGVYTMRAYANGSVTAQSVIIAR